jgi:hypothetical protein
MIFFFKKYAKEPLVCVALRFICLSGTKWRNSKGAAQ